MRTSRITAAVVVAALAVALTACSSSKPGETATLTILSDFRVGTPSHDIQAQVITAFEKKTGMKVIEIQGSQDLPQVYETSVVGGKEADIVITNLGTQTQNWGKDGITVNAAKYIDEWGLTDKILPTALDEWKDADGNAQGFPYQGFVWPVWYNTDLLAEAGVTAVPKTIDALIAAAAKLNAAGIPPMVVGGNDWTGEKTFLQIIQSYMKADAAKEVFRNGGYCTTPDAMKGIELFTQLRDAGVFIKDVQGYTADQMNAAFYTGGAAMMAAGSWAFTDTPTDLKVTLGGFPLPTGAAYTKPTAYQGYTGSGFWISANGEEKISAVKDFITAFYTQDIAAQWASKAAVPTAVVATSPLDIANPLFASAVNDLPATVDFVVMPDNFVGDKSDPLTQQTAAAFAPGTSAGSICAGLDSVYK